MLIEGKINLMKPSHYEIKTLLSDLLQHGTKEKIAKCMDLSPSLISQQCNPEKEKPSYFGLAIHFLFAVHKADRHAARDLIEYINAQHRSWNRDVPVGEESDAELTGAVGKEYVEAVEAEIGNRSDEVQLKEWRDTQIRVDKKIQRIESRISKKTESSRFDTRRRVS